MATKGVASDVTDPLLDACSYVGPDGRYLAVLDGDRSTLVSADEHPDVVEAVRQLVRGINDCAGVSPLV